MKREQVRKIILIAIIGFGVFAISYIILSGRFPLGNAEDDFVAYWSSGRLLSIGKDPYSPVSTMELTKELGFGESGLFLSYFYPPWTLPIFLPLGILSFYLSRSIWFFLSTFLYTACALWIWKIYRGPSKKVWIMVLCILLISPALFALYEGQVTPLILFGLVGFLYFEKSQRWFVAGSFLVLITFKPQMLYLFWIALIFWIIFSKRWEVLAGLIVTLAFLTLIVILIKPNILFDYLQMNSKYLPIYDTNPTLSTILYLLRNKWESWYLLVGPILGFTWFIFYWLRNKDGWKWINALPLLIFVSLLTAPYTWMHDGLLYIIAVIEIAILFLNKGVSRKANLMIILFILANLVVLLLTRQIRINQIVFIWIPIVYLILYLLSKHIYPEDSSSIQRSDNNLIEAY